MPNIDKITSSHNSDFIRLYTKRTCSDNSELYITSKLDMLYEQAISNKNLFNSMRNLRKMVQKNHLDEIV